MAGRTRKRTERGSAIVAAAIAAAILSIVVAGFLTYMTNEGRLAARSLAWKQALHLAEAAAEIGVAEFNYQYTEGGIGFSSGRGWASLGGGSYRKTVSNFTDNAGNVLGTLDVTVSGVGSSNPQVQGVGTANCAIGSQPVSRAVQVGFAGGSLFPMGLISKNRRLCT